jgi:hypothetical protein
VVAPEFSPPHAGAVVHYGERGPRGIRADGDPRRARVERVGDDLGEDGLLEGPGIGVPQILEEVEEIDAGLAHARSSEGAATAPSETSPS